LNQTKHSSFKGFLIVVGLSSIVFLTFGCGKIWESVTTFPTTIQPIFSSATWVTAINNGNIAGQFAGYGPKGTASTAFYPSGRTGGVTWADQAGNLWLFGGQGKDSAGTFGDLNDLWEYTPSTQKWNWISGSNLANQQGVYGAPNTFGAGFHPGGRWLSTSAIDAGGTLWLFGGSGYDATGVNGLLSDLWKYSPGLNQWSFVDGLTDTDDAGVYGLPGAASTGYYPGSRNGSTAWFDSGGKFWLFGGSGLDSVFAGGGLNDSWVFDTAALTWAYENGTKFANQQGIYGTPGVPANGNHPGGRGSLAYWQNGNTIWIFGGTSYDSVGTNGNMNDLWNYNLLTNQWAWVSGSNIVNQASSYGIQSLRSPTNVPGARTNQIGTWIDTSGNLWLLGGNGKDATGASGQLNDLWVYLPNSQQWAWVGGSNLISQKGIYGTANVAAYTNMPGARNTGMTWIDASGKFWLFGGFGYDSAGTSGSLGDLWLLGLP
jgi:N-acetylneuraminic acid mutarotase